jgi:curved DNA-binding protein CbpA
MSEQQLQVWVRNDKGQVYGPLSPPSIELLIDNSVIAGRMQISTDGINYVYPGRVPGLRMIFPKATWGDTVVPGDELDAQWSQVVMPASLPAGAAPAAAPSAGTVPGPPVMSSASGIRPGPPPGAGGPVAGPGARGPAPGPGARPQPGPQPARPMPGAVQGNRPSAVARPPGVGDFINSAPSGIRSSPSTVAPAGVVKSTPSVADFLNAAVTGGPATAAAPAPAVMPPKAAPAAAPAPAPTRSVTSSTGSGLRAAPPTGDVQIPPSGTLAETSVQQLYYLAAVSEVTGLLTLKVSDRELVAHFRKGNPEYLDSTHQEDSLEAFLLSQKLATQAQLDQAQAQAGRFGGELLGALFGLGLLNPNAVFQHLGQRASSLLQKVLAAEQGSFTFDLEDFPAAKSLPLGNKWAVYLEALRKVPISDVRRRLSRALELPVMKATGRAAVTDLRLTPQETRAHNYFDGVRSLAQLMKDVPGEADNILRTAWMLNPLELVSFAGVSVSAQKASAPPPPKPATAAAPPPAAKPAGPPGGAIPGGPPKISAPGAPPPQPKPAAPGNAAGTTVPGPPPAVAAARAATAPGNPVQMPKTGMPYPGGPQQQGAAPAPVVAPPPPAAAPQRPPPPVMKPAAPVVTAAPAAAPVTVAADTKQLQAQYEQMKKQNFFEVLGVKRDADANAVKIAYLKAARSYHPDTVAPGSPEALAKAKADIFALIGEANRTLSDAVLRADYVAELDAGGTGSKVDVEKILRAEEVFQKGRIMMQNRKYADGLKLFEEAVTCNADEAEFYAWRGYAKYLSATDRKASSTVAMKDLQHCISKNPNVATAYYFMGFIQKANGDEKNALANFKKTVSLDPKHIDAQREVRASKK